MNFRRYIAASLRHYRRSHLAVALGVAVATAVITGALLVGDSVRGSLRDLTLQRLGRIDQAVVTQQPFRAELADELAKDPAFSGPFEGVDVAFQLRGSLSSRAADKNRRYAGDIAIIGVTDRFATLGSGGPEPLGSDEAAITRPLADELGVAVGDEILLRLPTVGGLPADSPLGEKVDTTIGKRLTIAQVLPAEGLARFALAPSQTEPRNVFLAIETVQELVEQPGKANTLLVTSRQADQFSSPEQEEHLAELLRPRLEDYGLACDRIEPGEGPGKLQIESNQLVLRDEVVTAAEKAFGKERLQPVVTYLANTISAGEKSIAYSTIVGVQSSKELGPLVTRGVPLGLSEGEIALNDWAAEQLGAELGDDIKITYYQPESTHGELVEAEPLRLKLRAIVPLEEDTGQPTLAADPRLSPELKGVTDADSINDWDLPFELIEPITQADEDYWDDHRTTPKAFVSLDLAKRLWGTRWGDISLLRLDGEPQEARAALRDAIDPSDMGFALLPVKRQGLAASSGTTPFEGLFIGFSLFLIASAVMLIALLFGLGVEARGREVGLLSAVGWDRRAVQWSLVREGVVIALAGVCLGIPAGIGYAGLMIWGLTTAWVDAIVTPFLRLHVTLPSLAIGGVAGLVASWLAIRSVTGRLLRRPARALLSGQTGLSGQSGDPGKGRQQRGLITRLAAPVLLLAAAGLAFAATTLRGESQAGAFFGSGAALLTGLLLAVRSKLNTSGTRRDAPTSFGLSSLAWRNIARSAGRSVLTIALMASASFLILAIGAFRLAPTEAGTGGFVLVGQSDQPLQYDLNTDQGRLELGFSRDEEALLKQFDVSALRLHDGEDASCLNLYQTRQPRVLGVPELFIERGGFDFATVKDDAEKPWALLRSRQAEPQSPAHSPQPLPVILDFNTAMYSLKLYGGVGARFTIQDEADRPVELEVVALLKNSLLQGDLLLSEANFLRLFPSVSGSRFFLIEEKSIEDTADDTNEPSAKLTAMLEQQLSDHGLDLERADRRLAEFLAVQNTYLSTFQTLGALGLLLGVVGVAVVQLRNLAERRAELALMQASGFQPLRLRSLVLRENLWLLAGGLVIGAVAALLALAPQIFAASAATASVPWASSALLLGGILLVGVLVGGWATRAALRAPLIPALRGD